MSDLDHALIGARDADCGCCRIVPEGDYHLLLDLAQRAEAALERVRALAEEWEGTVYKLPPDYPMSTDEFVSFWFKRPLRDALDPKAKCPTCGPTTTEQHPRWENVTRCANCKEWR